MDGIVALEDGDLSMSYAELEAQAERVAQFLKAAGVRQGAGLALVGWSVCADLVLIMLAIWKLEACYVPINSQSKAAKCRFIIQENADGFKAIRKSYSLVKLSSKVKLDYAYVIYTSGTVSLEGTAVHVPKSSVMKNISAMKGLVEGLEMRTVILSPPTFDPSIADILLTLEQKGTIVFCSEKIRNTPAKLVKFIAEKRVNYATVTPSLLLMFTDEDRVLFLDQFQVLLVGGEDFPVSLISLAAAAKARVWNIYGTTECSIWASSCLIQDGMARVPIGKFFEGVLHMVVDGELFIGGEERRCVLEEETLEQAPLLRSTGDLVEEINGNLYIIGRKGGQVKVFGKRVNLFALERYFTAIDGVLRCIMNMFSGQLVAVFQLREDSSLHELTIRLSEKLALAELEPHQVPQEFFVAKTMELTPNGKIDRKKLEVDLQGGQLVHVMLDQFDSLPDLKEFIVQAAKRLLAIDSLRLSDNLIQLGGDSIIAKRIASRVRAALHLTEKAEQKLFVSLINDTLERAVEDLQQPPQIQQTSGYQAMWMFHMEKCIDASPLLHNGFVYVGSHSGLFVKLNATTGKCEWQLRLPDRIESSAAFHEGYVIAGCYDERIYCISAVTGDIAGFLQTQGIVKASPAVDHFGKVWCGSYDKKLYIMELKHGRFELLKRFEFKGSIFAKVSLSQDYAVSVSTKGEIAAFRVGSSALMWRKEATSPLFASPVQHEGKLFVASVSGTVTIFSLSSGQELFVIQSCSSPIFASPLIIESSVIVATHKPSVECFDFQGSQIWKLEASGGVFFSSPVCYEDRVACFLSNGTLFILNTRDGSLQVKHSGFGEVFSTPVIRKEQGRSFIYFGSRDEYLYKLQAR